MTKLGADEMHIGDVARESGLTTATINYYVSEGVLPAPRKLSRTRAAYSKRHVRLLRLIRGAQSSIGLSLAQIKNMLEFYGTDEAGLTKLEGFGTFQPIPAVWGEPRDATMDHFEPIELDAFLALTGATRELVGELEDWGVLRPRAPGIYDANDAWLVRTVDALLHDGVELEWLAYNRELIPLLRQAAAVVQHLALRHLPALRSRELRYRDLMAPFAVIADYMFNRLRDEADPGWRDLMFREA